MPSDLRTRAIVLRRTNFGEADRILNFLTPEGKISAIARSVRKEKSRLAGAIELFSVADVVIHQGKSNLAILTSAKMLQFFSNILADVERLELAALMLKKVERAAEQISSPEHFSLLIQGLDGLNRGLDSALVRVWFLLNLDRAGGEDLNLLRDVGGEDLRSDAHYFWDFSESALHLDPNGPISAREIKFARFLLANSLLRAAKVDYSDRILSNIKAFIRE